MKETNVYFIGFNIFIVATSIPMSLSINSDVFNFVLIFLLYLVIFMAMIIFGTIKFPFLTFVFIPTLPLIFVGTFVDTFQLNAFGEGTYLGIFDRWQTLLIFVLSIIFFYWLFYTICPPYAVRDISLVKGSLISIIIAVLILILTYYIPQKLTAVMVPTDITVHTLTSASDLPDDIKHFIKDNPKFTKEIILPVIEKFIRNELNADVVKTFVPIASLYGFLISFGIYIGSCKLRKLNNKAIKILEDSNYSLPFDYHTMRYVVYLGGDQYKLNFLNNKESRMIILENENKIIKKQD
jgi:hypothetical protein